MAEELAVIRRYQRLSLEWARRRLLMGFDPLGTPMRVPLRQLRENSLLLKLACIFCGLIKIR